MSWRVSWNSLGLLFSDLCFFSKKLAVVRRSCYLLFSLISVGFMCSFVCELIAFCLGLPFFLLSCSSCFNGGTCVDGINSFTSQYPLGFTGPFCLTEINECDSHPCLNRGTCVDSLGTYRCICPLGYTGKNCKVGDFLWPLLPRALLFELSSSKADWERCEVPNVAELLFFQSW